MLRVLARVSHQGLFNQLSSLHHPVKMAARQNRQSHGYTEHLARLRALMKSSKQPLDAYIINNRDSHYSDFLSHVDIRTFAISGFTSRRAFTVITDSKAAIWTDRRWFHVAELQLDPKVWTLFLEDHPDTISKQEYLFKELPPNAKIGIDLHYISYTSWKHLKKELSAAGHALISVKDNLIDALRQEAGIPSTPTPPEEQPFVLDIKYSGKSWQDKVIDIREQIKRRFAYAFVVTKLDELAWLFNIRGHDVPFNLLIYGFAIVTLDSISIFIDERKLTKEITAHLGLKQDNLDDTMKIKVFPYNMITSAVSDLGKLNKRIWMSTDVVAALGMLVKEENLLIELSPVARRKVVKNPVELRGMKSSNLRDSIALCNFWSWLDQEVPTGKVTTIAAADKLEEYCKKQVDFITNCFTTLSHLDDVDSQSTEDGQTINDNGLYICGSGRHYRDGTTNITRVMHYGTPTEWEKECYTRVLMAMIDGAATVFPRGTTGQRIDAISRRPLWNVGLEWIGFTGHGVGHALSVTEDHYGISPTPFPQEMPLTEGMCCTVEPAFSDEADVADIMPGIRLETLFVVEPVELKRNYRKMGFLKFEPLAFVPFARKLLITSLLNKEQIDWLNNYHALCIDVLTPLLKEHGRTRTLKWLLREARPLELD